MSSKLQSDGCYLLSVMAPIGKRLRGNGVGMMCLRCKKTVIHAWALRRWVSDDGALYTSLSTFTFYLLLSLPSEVSCNSCLMLCVTRQFSIWENCYAPTCLWFLLCPRYLFNAIRFHFHLTSREFPTSAYIRIQPISNSSSERHGTDRQTNRQKPAFIS